jgi:dTDP-3-amino-2,3,6-trideoxy-4-keto-D-glucose/dTDP-3-amino-3,4,6-trideoxy-alpha-D-glucose/dTDP-2,6-dideoxy-D-kanosamine transaminase
MALNFLPIQYERDNLLPINHNYLQQQFADHDEVWAKVREVVIRGDFTLGRAVDEFEAAFARLTGTCHAIGVGSGTDAIFLSLKALGVGPGDEVITAPFTFYATVGAIVTAGARPVFVDIADDFNIDVSKVESAITPQTKAIVPIHWSGKPCDMHSLRELADRHGLRIVEDACHAILASRDGVPAGSIGDAGCFSMHPLKNLNVWGDGGVIVTNNDETAKRLRLLRNHGLVGRDTCAEFAYNSRLDTVQAVVALHMLEKIEHVTNQRIRNAKTLDAALGEIAGIRVPERANSIKQVFHIYSVMAERRDDLQRFLISRGVDAKVHYPTPMHLQPAAAEYGYKAGDFPQAEAASSGTISLPVHEFISDADCATMISLVREFYR